MIYYFKTSIVVADEKLEGSGQFLAEQLEKYLNDHNIQLTTWRELKERRDKLNQ